MRTAFIMHAAISDGFENRGLRQFFPGEGNQRRYRAGREESLYAGKFLRAERLTVPAFSDTIKHRYIDIIFKTCERGNHG